MKNDKEKKNEEKGKLKRKIEENRRRAFIYI